MVQARPAAFQREVHRALQDAALPAGNRPGIPAASAAALEAHRAAGRARGDAHLPAAPQELPALLVRQRVRSERRQRVEPALRPVLQGEAAWKREPEDVTEPPGPRAFPQWRAAQLVWERPPVAAP